MTGEREFTYLRKALSVLGKPHNLKQSLSLVKKCGDTFKN
jgi:hypothetical protein